MIDVVVNGRPQRPTKLKDIGGNVLPPYDEEFREGARDTAQAAAYRDLAARLTQELKQALAKRDTTRLKVLLEQEGFKVAVLRASVDASGREDWIAEQLNRGIDVLITNPELVKTGLDLAAPPGPLLSSAKPAGLPFLVPQFLIQRRVVDHVGRGVREPVPLQDETSAQQGDRRDDGRPAGQRLVTRSGCWHRFQWCLTSRRGGCIWRSRVSLGCSLIRLCDVNKTLCYFHRTFLQWL